MPRKIMMLLLLAFVLLSPAALQAQVADWNLPRLQSLLDDCVKHNLNNVLPANCSLQIKQATPHSIEVVLSAPSFINDSHSAELAGRTIVYNILQYVFSMKINTQVYNMDINCLVREKNDDGFFVYGTGNYNSSNDTIIWNEARY